MLKGVAMSVVIVGIMFFFTYLPQVAALAFVTGPLGSFRFQKSHESG